MSATLDFTALMQQAMETARAGISAGQSPFGAVISTSGGEIVSAAHNMVRIDCDPTAHAEVAAIRRACAKLGTIDLSGHVVVATCEPCPMCTCAIHWARLDAVIYGATIADAKSAGFSELSVSAETLYRQGGSRVSIFPQVLRDKCLELFELWKQGPNPQPY